MEPIRVALLGAGSRGTHVYAAYAKAHPQEMRIVAVAEPDDVKRQHIVEEHAVKTAYAVKDWHDLFVVKQDFDAVVIATQDSMHRIVSGRN